MIEALSTGKVSECKQVSRQIDNFTYGGSALHWVGTLPSRIYVLNAGELRSDIIYVFHDAGHLGIDNIYNAVARYAYWPYMFDAVANYVSSCHDCQTKGPKSAASRAASTF